MVEGGERGTEELRWELTMGRLRALGISSKDLISTTYFLCALSVPIPFRGDYIGLQGNPKLQKLKGGAEGPVLVADTVKKVNRGNGKVKAPSRNPPQSLLRSLGAGSRKGGGAASPFLTLYSSVPRLLLEFFS